MKFSVEREIESRVFTVTVKFLELGNDSLTSEEEKKLFNDFGYPLINVGGEFKNGEGEQAFVFNRREVVVDEAFEVSRSFKVDQKSKGENLNKEVEKAVADCKVFEDEIKSRIQEAIQDIHSKAISFEDGYPLEFRV